MKGRKTNSARAWGAAAALGVVALSAGVARASTVPEPTDAVSGALTDISDICASAELEATDTGVTAETISVEVIADVGAAVAPGLFQASHDSLGAFAEYVNANGGVGCRQLELRLWDSKLNADESKNGQIDACSGALAMVGGVSLFNPDMSTIETCADAAGNATGLADIPGFANDDNQQCNPTTFPVQSVATSCPAVEGEREFHAFVGTTQWYLEQYPGLHGAFIVGGDVPTTVQSATYQIAGAEAEGVVWDSLIRVSSGDTQSDFTSRVQQLRDAESTYVYSGTGTEASFVNLRKEANAQGLESVEVWACSITCYSDSFLATGGADVEGTYLWMPFLPFEEREHSSVLDGYLSAIGEENADSFGARAWMAAAYFQEVVARIVAADGPNAITRARVLEELAAGVPFTADGWVGPRDSQGLSSCFMIVQVVDGAFQRAHPEEPGTFDCDEGNMHTVLVDPAAAAAEIP